MAKGGKMPGAGRPKGSTTLPKIRDHISEKEIKELVAKAKTLAQSGDTNLLKFLLEQIYGKAPQSIELPSGNGEIIIKWKNK